MKNDLPEAARAFYNQLKKIGETLAYFVVNAPDAQEVELLNAAKTAVMASWKIDELRAANIVRLGNYIYVKETCGKEIYTREQLAIVIEKAFSAAVA